jgi:GPH family glycoside/pentoside/hexuronide:cation symporter
MSNKKQNNENQYSTKKAFFYGFAGLTDIIMFQFFSFLIFTFFYAVVGLNVNLITIGFIIWSIWNALNDPMLGAISDRTSTKWGRRKPYIIVGIYSLLILNILLWTPPLGSQLTTFIYFLIIIVVWEGFYTMYSLNQTALFPEMFRDLEQRAKANTIVQLFQISALMIAFILPSFFIPRYDDPQYFSNYLYAAICVSLICLVTSTIFIKLGLQERIEFSKDPENAPSFLNSLKFTLNSKAFRKYIVADFSLWYCFSLLPILTPLFGSFVLGIKDSFVLSMLLATAFLSAAGFVFFWRYVIRKYGVKKAFLWGMITFIATLFPFMFISDSISAFIAYFCLGIGLSGALILENVTVSAIIDEDELNTGVRREGGFFGINGFVVKLTNVFVFLTIALVFNSVGWTIFDPKGTTEETILGLRSLMFVFPSIVLGIGILFMLQFPITKEKYESITKEAGILHEKKLKRIENQ